MQLIQGLGGMLLAQEVTKRLSKPGAYNIFNRSYTEIHEDNTTAIDSLIMEPGRGIPGPVIIASGTKSTPAPGHHYYTLLPDGGDCGRPQRYCYVGLIKVKGGQGGGGEEQGEGRSRSTEAHYIIWEPRFSWWMLPLRWPKGKSPIDRFKLILKNRERGALVTYRIDSTSYHAMLYSLSVDHPLEMKLHQKTALDFILRLYRDRMRGTFLFSGPRGSGKTTSALQLKRQIEDEYPNTSVTLVSNFNPSQTGVDINKLILRDITQEFPCVIVVNEIETHFETAATDPAKKTGASADKRFTHTADRTTFHDMLDTVAGTRRLILILATEKSFEELWEKQEYRSFLRQGRVHGIVQMTHTDAICSANTKRDDD